MKSLVCCVVASLVLVSPAFAEYRIALVNVAKVLNDSPSAREKREDLDSRAKKTRAKLDDQRDDLRALEKKLREAGTPDTSKEVASLRSRARDFERTVRDSDEELRAEYMKVNRALSERLMKIVSAIAKQKNLSIVLDKGEIGRSPVLYGSEALDITDDVLEAME